VSQQPSRYQRSFPALVGAMLVTVAFVLVFVAWRALFRSDVDTEPVAVDWTDSVELADEAGLPVVRPRSLPDGWIATSVELRASADPRWGLGVLTDDEQFIGVRQEDSSVEELVRTYVDEEAVAGDDVTIASDVADTWQTWSDDGGDRGYSTELGDDAVLVYGSAPAEDIEAYLGLLTQE
jgi:hypothetical protein